MTTCVCGGPGTATGGRIDGERVDHRRSPVGPSTSPPRLIRADVELFVTDWTLCDWPPCDTGPRGPADSV